MVDGENEAQNLERKYKIEGKFALRSKTSYTSLDIRSILGLNEFSTLNLQSKF